MNEKDKEVKTFWQEWDTKGSPRKRENYKLDNEIEKLEQSFKRKIDPRIVKKAKNDYGRFQSLNIALGRTMVKILKEKYDCPNP